VGEVTTGAPEHQFVGVGGVVELTLNEVGKVRRHPGDFRHDPLGHVVAQSRLLGAIGAYRKVEGETARRVLTRGSQIRVVERRDLQVERRRLGNEPTYTAFEVELHLFGRVEEGYIPAEPTLIEDLIGADELGQAVECEMDLKIGGPVIDGINPLGERLRHVIAIEQPSKGRRGVEI
jgi:hypothetical protein